MRLPAYLLTTATVATCPHGGQVTFAAGQNRVLADNAPVLVETDEATISGCPFTVGTSPSPCVLVRWSAPAVHTTIGEAKALLTTSQGTCLNPASAPQGTIVVSANQARVQAS